MKIRDRQISCALLIVMAGGSSLRAAPTDNQPSTLLQSPGGATCSRASNTQLAEIQGFLSFIKTQLDSISDARAADAGRAATASIELALSSGCLETVANSFAQLRDRPLGNSDAAYQIWRSASSALSNIARSQGAPDRVEALDIASAQEVASRWKRPPAEVADFYFSALGARLQAGYANKDPKSLDRALTIARERVLPLADKQATPEVWFRVHFLIGDMLSGKTNWLEPGETRGDLAKQSIAATELALQGKAPDDVMLFMARWGLAAGYAIASSDAEFADQSLNEKTVVAIRDILSDPRFTPDLAVWGYFHDTYARAAIIPAQTMQNPERSRRIKDALAVVEQGLAKIDRDRNLLVWARLQTDRGIAAVNLGADQPDEAYAVRNLDLAIASFEAILAVKEQLNSSGGQDIVTSTQANLRETLSKKAIFASPKARPARPKR